MSKNKEERKNQGKLLKKIELEKAKKKKELEIREKNELTRLEI